MVKEKKYEDLIIQVGELQLQLNEALETIEAIRSGEVDAFVVKNGHGNQIYTLRSADFNYRIFIEKMAEGAVTLNKEGLILYCNSSFAKMLGLSLAEVLGVPFETFIPVGYKKLINKMVTRGWREECKAEIILPGENNKEIPVLLSINPLDTDVDPCMSIIVTDLSFQKQSQAQQIEMDKKDEFITIASHELRTPVTSIKGYIQLLKYTFMQEGNKVAAELLTKADLQVNKLTSLINDLLDVKKMEKGQLIYHEAHFDFNCLVKEMLEETGRTIHHHTIHCELDTTGMVYGDRNKVGQVISNFIDNAAKYSAAGTPIYVKTVYKDTTILLSVQDAGMGIPKDQQQKIFDRFFRVSGDKENTYSGLGLGLYISKEIINRHYGYIGVDSEPGKGSTFYFVLPITAAHDES